MATAKEDDVSYRLEAILAAKEAELEAARKKKDTIPGKIMKNGGGAATGAFAGSVAAPLVVAGVAAVLAPFTGGLSVAAAAALTAGAVIGGGVVGHKLSQDDE